jgi:uracil phosphoribosyltransferase
VPILRAGNGILDGMIDLLPSARVGHIGIYREPRTFEAVEYYLKLPDDLGERDVIVVDPMLATGASALACTALLTERGADIADLRFICLIAAPEGLKTLFGAHPRLRAYTCAVDRHLNDHGYIIPGLGDAGDRLFGAGAGRVPETAVRAARRKE